MEIATNPQHSRKATLLTAGVALLVAFVLLMAYQFVSGRRQLLEELHTEASIIGANSSAALVFNDEKAAREILSAIEMTPRILNAALYRADGTLLVSQGDVRGVFPRHISAYDPTTAYGTGWERFLSKTISQEVIQDGTPVGTLLLHVTNRSLYRHMIEYAVGVILIGALALLITSHFTAGLRKRMAHTEGQLHQMALYDRVTGLPNRRFFEHELESAVGRVKREGKCGALLFIDVDDFKKVNDLCGHQAGDEVLQMIAERLRHSIRSADMIARVGGDEFAAILYGVGGPENAAKVAAHMISAMREPFPTEPIPSHVGLSIGLAMMPNDGEDPDTLLRWSDMAMYVAKSHGKNRYQFFSEDINRKVRSELELEGGLRKALQDGNDELWVAYQPQLSAKTRELVGVEALMRWTMANGTIVSPGEFIPVAEKSGLIVDLGQWLLNRICTDLAEMRAQGIDIPKVAVNVSPRELTRGNIVVEQIRQTIEQHGEREERFQFELTESTLMNESGSQVLNALRQAGFTLAIDDFGSGYSSLGYLKRFDVSTLKIDRQFIQHLPADTENAAIVTAVIQMSKALGIAVIAEGVETEAQADFLASSGCDYLQGFLLSRPVSTRDLIAYATARMESALPVGA